MISFPDKRYNIILADPPWPYKDQTCSGGVGSQYATMPLRDICDLPVASICTPDAVLFLWTTYPFLSEALQVISAWGFTYKSIAFQWVKLNRSGIGYFYGLGRWTRGNTEPCLLATRGKPKRISPAVSQLVLSRLRHHSEKPGIVRLRIVKLLGDLPRIELFARKRILGWDAWGDQVARS